MVVSPTKRSAPVPDQDQRILMHNMSWWQFETILAARGDRSVPRISYLSGTLELMSPSKEHENKKSNIGMLIEAYAFGTGVQFVPLGSMTQKDLEAERGAEPDESYAFGAATEAPDLVIEVVLTSGGLDKLELYRGLGVREVWFWIDDELRAYALGESGYEPIKKSVALRGLPIATIARYARRKDAFDAVQSFRRAIARKKRAGRARKPR